MRSVSVFGATGSIGQGTVDLLLRQGGPAAYRTVALTGGRNVAGLAKAARALQAELAVIAEEALLPDLRAALSGTATEAAAGAQALAEAADRPAGWVMSGIIGAAGLVPGLRALAHGGTLALANKESLVSAGPLMLATAARHGTRILPVDSEHSAIFQSLTGEDIGAVEAVTITASGGAFRDWPLERLARASVAEASTHPNWAMGQRITIDSASMFNKAMEIIETHAFFGIEPERIRVLIHPESMLHALVSFRDGGMIGHLGAPDMRHAIGYALNWPVRRTLPVARLDLGAVGALHFAAPDPARYPALGLARAVMATGGLAGAAFTAAKEAALDAFIACRIGFVAMAPVVEEVLSRLSAAGGLGNRGETLDTVLDMDAEARRVAGQVIDAMMRA